MEQRMEGFVQVSRAAVWATAILFVLATGFLMLVMLNLDLDEVFGAGNLVMKVGGTAVTRADFAELKLLSGPKTEKISDGAFAEELLETLLLAEAGRRLRLDRQTDFVSRVQAFDRAIAAASGPIDLSRSLFLLEELARRTRLGVLEAADAELLTDAETVGQTASETAEEARPARLHLRTILTPDEAAADAVLNAAAGGVPFAELNTSWSRSPYAGTGGDLGWVGPEDLPPGIYERCESTPVGSLTRAFSDGNGVHLFLVEAKPAASPAREDRRRLGRIRAERRQRALDRFMENARANIPWFVHPSLRRP
ncbi:MAG TPA: peptidylprolyl isomerase [Candidatus Ozemobacteraceae bacterium]|nr:peptidylprolyl isomerase [Candidatus Ozemobacteraceae bacterium]